MPQSSEFPAPAALPADVGDALSGVAGRLSRLGSPLLYFPTTGSTNDVAAFMATSGAAEGTTIVAGHQTAGRGRRGRTWFSPAGSGLYVSVIVAPGRAAREPGRAVQLMTMAAGLGLAEGIQAQTGLRTDIKWPNDLFAGGRKLAGILAEGVMTESGASGSPALRALRVVLGYGINLSSTAYPPDLRDRATSLESELGREVGRAGVLAETLAALAARYDDLLAGRFDAILDAWRARARGVEGARVEWDTPSGARSGTTCGVDREGALLVRSGGDVERIVSGELRWGCF